MANPHRTVIWEARFEQQLAALEPNTRRADAFVDAATWVLSRNPESGT